MPLADQMRPKTLDEVVGQAHLLGQGRVLRRVIESGQIPNMIFYGPSGVGKTTVASVIAQRSNMRLHRLNATTASSGDVRDVIREVDTLLGTRGILLYLDEIQYFNKKQQQTLLEYVETGSITLIASTTENPYFYVYGALLSRCTVFEFKPVEPSDILPAVRRGMETLSESGVQCQAEEGVAELISQSCSGDVRKALNAVELCWLAAEERNGARLLTLDHAREVSQRSAMRYDRDGDNHYDLLSAFQKSIRGSDPDAAVYYMARLLHAGDLPSACRRLLVTAAEDIGLAYPQAMTVVKSCVDAALQVGLPEAQLPLAEAVILLATAPKSNAAAEAMWSAMADIEQGGGLDVPVHLKDAHYKGSAKLGHGTEYVYPHGYVNDYYPQQYLPDDIRDRQYYRYGTNKAEQAAKAYWESVKALKNPPKKG